MNTSCVFCWRIAAEEADRASLEIKSAREIRDVMTTPARCSGSISFEFKDTAEMERAKTILDVAIRAINHPPCWSKTPPTAHGAYWYRQNETALLQVFRLRKHPNLGDEWVEVGGRFEIIKAHEFAGEFWSEPIQEPPR